MPAIPPRPTLPATDDLFVVMLNSLRLARPVVEVALERAGKDPARSGADLRHLEAACAVFKQDANTLVALLIACPGNDDLIAEADALFRFFGQVEAQIGAVLDASRS